MLRRWGQLAAAAGALDDDVLDDDVFDDVAAGADSVVVLDDEVPEVLADSLAVEPLRESVR